MSMVRESSQGRHLCLPHLDKARVYTNGRMIWRVSAVRSIQRSVSSFGATLPAVHPPYHSRTWGMGSWDRRWCCRNLFSVSATAVNLEGDPGPPSSRLSKFVGWIVPPSSSIHAPDCFIISILNRYLNPSIKATMRYFLCPFWPYTRSAAISEHISTCCRRATQTGQGNRGFLGPVAGLWPSFALISSNKCSLNTEKSPSAADAASRVSSSERFGSNHVSACARPSAVESHRAFC
mmetsp:Transcript_9655/g.20025  ORF Transcript_9655/g.20025 Transcript_9655/m.20025 type:complete len:235 (+) Transcript_9655:60-764(+)